MRVTRYIVVHPGWQLGGASIHPDRLKVEDDRGNVLIDISMSGDSPIRPYLSAIHRRPWFYTGSPFGAEIVDFVRKCEARTLEQERRP